MADKKTGTSFPSLKSRKYTVDEIFSMLTKQAFADFYNEGGEFDEFITGGDPDGVTEDEIKIHLQYLLGKQFRRSPVEARNNDTHSKHF